MIGSVNNDHSDKGFGGSSVSQPVSSSSFGTPSSVKPVLGAGTGLPPVTAQSTSRQPPSVDRYAALADLDNMFHTMNVPFEGDGKRIC